MLSSWAYIYLYTYVCVCAETGWKRVICLLFQREPLTCQCLPVYATELPLIAVTGDSCSIVMPLPEELLVNKCWVDKECSQLRYHAICLHYLTVHLCHSGRRLQGEVFDNITLVYLHAQWSSGDYYPRLGKSRAQQCCSQKSHPTICSFCFFQEEKVPWPMHNLLVLNLPAGECHMFNLGNVNSNLFNS